MSKLEEALELMDIIHDFEGRKSSLNQKVSELLQENKFGIVKKDKYITAYRSQEASNKVFVEYGQNRYCFTELEEQQNIVMQDFYKNLKVILYPSKTFSAWTPIIFGSIWLAGGIVSGIGSFLLGALIEDRELGSYVGLLGFFISCIGGLGISNIYEKHFDKRAENHLKETCKKIYHDKEALEKAFGGKE